MENVLEEKNKIALQKERAFGPLTALQIEDACRVNKGILQFTEAEKRTLINNYLQTEYKTTFFIPASGSGSRMFDFLFEFLNFPDETNRGKTEKFLNNIEKFAFSQKVPHYLLRALKDDEIPLEDFIDFLLTSKGLNLGNLPKGLIPFHRIGPFVLSPFQEQIVQGIEIANGNPTFHFTINENFKTEIKAAQKLVTDLISQKVKIEYSVQNKETDAYVFDEKQKIVQLEDGTPYRRPAGHGSLIENLNAIKSDLIFIKNIDNLQHFSKHHIAKDAYQLLSGLIIKVELERNELLDHFSKENFRLFNSKYEILLDEEIDQLSEKELRAVIDRPIRVCGMVKNEGEPGGGPFWLKKDGITRKQIIEKSQINTRDKQYKLLINSTHFNPVIMVLRNADKDGKPFNLTSLVDESQYFNVQKTWEGKRVFFTENPGLWNGGMYDWLTIFVEIPAEVFTPVKNILNLLSPLHQENA